ncbi:hypothetical protein XH98_31040 [Bradyrhizobium sp. CCBAU 51745]|uniref:hypothetical protein n=1 Tax=Bradyrhizobium sp. CCBAU 51745 TaxID=1325099 RepID=UPI0023056122|nr:hypothetical protein [Bradyrhizobium sp. CCBAU 51745]MDA9443445.1 hypothetical protein [Bradyrhizobium sp. CCBAU 51745]
MMRGTLGILLAGSLVAATAAMAIPVTPDPDRDGPADGIDVGWYRSSGANTYVDETWWATRNRCTPDYLGERLICGALRILARAASRTFEAKMSDDAGLPLPASWELMTAKNAFFIRSGQVETPLDLATVASFYRAALGQRGWIEKDGAVITPDRAEIAFTTPDGPAMLRLTRQDNRTIVDLSVRKRADATAGIPPKPGQVRLMLGNETDEAAAVNVNERTISLAPHVGEKLAHTDDAASEGSDIQKIDLPPGKHRITVKVEGNAARSRELEVAANETWGLLVGPDGAPLPIRLY